MDDGDARTVAARFGLGTVVAPPQLAARGANGVVWKVTTERGAFAVKRMQPWIVDERRPFDVDVQLAASEAGVSLPRPVLAVNGAAIVDRTRVYEWVDVGGPPATPCTAELAAEVGSILGRSHMLAIAPPSDIDPWYTTAPRRDRWDDLAHRGRDAGAAWAGALAAEVDYLDDVGHRASEPSTGPVRTCHRDLAPSNVVPSMSDGRLVVLDWENAGPLQTDAELAWTLVLWCADRERVDLDACEVLVRAYADVTGCAPPMTPASFHVGIVTHLNFLAVTLDHSLDPAQAGGFVDDWIEQLAPANLRRRVIGIDLLVDAFGSFL